MVRKIRDFDLRQIAESGQCFRMDEIGPGGCFKNVAGGRLLLARKIEEDTFYFSCSEEEFDTFWFWHFGLDLDYGEIRQQIRAAAERDGNDQMIKAMQYGGGIRILRQDFWEAAVSYIISQNNSILRIKRAVDSLCRAAGQRIYIKDETLGVEVEEYTFPSLESLMALSSEELYQSAFFYRLDCFYSFVDQIRDGRLGPGKTERQDYLSARAALMEVYGIGPKVADCICLYGLNYPEAFPVDTWVRNTLLKWHNGPAYEGLSKDAALRAIIRDHYDVYGKYKGIAQQYLFYYERQTGKRDR